MGNNPSSSARPPQSPSSSSTTHDSPRNAPRRDARNLIHPRSQRTAARPEPPLAQAHGYNVVHRRPPSQSDPRAVANLIQPTTNQNQNQNPNPISSDSQAGAQSTTEPLTKPVDVPVSKPVSGGNDDNDSESSSKSLKSQSIDPAGPSSSTQDMSYHLTRPPRLPLPIEEEVHTPGSPIIPPADSNEPIPVLDVGELDDEALPRHESALSNTTVDEDDDELTVDKTKATVPTTFKWREGGSKVYVTGTIFQWNKKHRLHPVEGQTDLLRAVIHIRPGTHHIRFIVDGDMRCSTNLPTTVDFGNNLVNYIEVSPEDIPQPTEPETPAEKEEVKIPQVEPKQEELPRPRPKTRSVLPPSRYSSKVPQYLEDLDKSEDSTAYQYAAAAIEKLPTPPSLPGFLGKPILNAATPMKDDNSVLTMPNHTVLNHLATSSIKQNILAVSVTTRYKRKYVTTIMYKPTGGDD